MKTNYNDIAAEYQSSKLAPWRTHIERFTLLRVAGDIQGLKTLDLACGEGYYTRLLRKRGAQSVLGVDLSQGMIELANAQESADPLGIRYQVGDAAQVDEGPTCDLVFAAYLLNYASNYEELLGMCQAIARNLSPGGRFVTVNNDPDDPPENFETGRVYGFSKRLEGPLVEGAPIVWCFHLKEGTIEVTNYYLRKETITRALREAGLQDIRWHTPQISPEGLQEFGESFWNPFLAFPPITFLEAAR